MNLLILGHGKHGKDTLAEQLLDKGGLYPKLGDFNFTSSSRFLLEPWVYPRIKDELGYSSPEECYADRENHRDLWYDLICEYVKDDKARLARDIFKVYDVYVGMRADDEYQACLDEDMFDYILWIDASKRKAQEPRSSFNIDFNPDIMYWFDNNRVTIESLEQQVIRFLDIID